MVPAEENVWQTFGTEGLVWMFLFIIVMFFAGLAISPAIAAVMTVASAINQTGNTIATFSDAGEVLVLVAVQVAGALVWRVVANDGAVLS